MTWVKETLPPRLRRRWLLTTIRLSAISFAGTARTLVAVGTDSDASMLATTRAAAPRSVVVLASVGATVGVLAGVGRGCGAAGRVLAAGGVAAGGVATACDVMGSGAAGAAGVAVTAGAGWLGVAACALVPLRLGASAGRVPLEENGSRLPAADVPDVS